MNQKINRHLPEVILAGVVILTVVVLILKTATHGMAEADRIACLSNLHQLGQAMEMYRDDYDQTMVLGPDWQRQVRGYMSKKGYAVFLCPARPQDPGMSYGLNYLLAGKKDVDIHHPVNTILLTDVRDSTPKIWWSNDIRYLVLSPNRFPVACHLGRTNVAFYDGHVKTEYPSDFTKENWYP